MITLATSLNPTLWEVLKLEEHEGTRRVEKASKMLHWLCLGQHLSVDTKLKHTEVLCREYGTSLSRRIWCTSSAQKTVTFLEKTGTPAAFVSKLLSSAGALPSGMTKHICPK